MSTLRVDTIANTAGVTNQRVLQVVQGTISLGQVSTTSTSFVDSGYYLNITPTSTASKIIVSSQFNTLGTASTLYSTIYRDNTTNLMQAIHANISGLSQWGTAAFSFLDSPATTAQVKYSIYFRVTSGTGYISHTGSATPLTSQVFITAMEIAG